MKTSTTAVKVTIERLWCDKCEDTEMRPRGDVLLSHPPQYPYVCPDCGHKVTSRTRYPQVSATDIVGTVVL